MKSLCIKTNNTNTLEYLLNELDSINLNNICFTKKQFKHYQNIIIHYSGNNTNEFLKEISSILSFLIIDEYENDLLNRILMQNYFYFDKTERNKILDICFNITIDDFNSIFEKKLNTLSELFFEYLCNCKSIVLTGFINFRISKYLNILDEIASEAVNHFIIEKEYLEFVSLLKLYINTQPSNSNLVHIIYSNSESVLLDEYKKLIKVDTNTFSAKYLSDISFSSNDYTLNSLLTILPKKICVHLIDNSCDEFIDTLQLIFENRISICTDCNICRLYKTTYKTT